MRGGRREGSWGLGVSNSARIFKRFRNHVRNNLNRSAVNDSIQTRQTRSITAQQRWRGSILPFLLNSIQCICTPTPLILVTLTPRSSLHPSLGVLIYLTSYHYAFPDCACKMLESCSLKCQRITKKYQKLKKVAS